MKKIFVLALLVLTVQLGFSQIGGQHTYDFLNLVAPARIASLGGVNVSTFDDDPNFGFQNPALVNDSMHNKLSLSQSFYLAGIKHGFSSYSYSLDSINSFHTGVQYMSSGKMQGYDEFANPTQTFSANEFSWVVGYSRAWRRFRYGANLKVISSTLAPGFSSMGMALDIGGSYHSKDKLFSAGLVFSNIGMQLSTYIPGAERAPLPFQISGGISQKLRYMPLRFSITTVQLEHPNLIYRDPNPEPIFDLGGNEIKPPNQTADRIFRHFVFSAEFLIGRVIRLRGGYNHMRRQELRSLNRGGMSGFSLGVGLRLSFLQLDYGFSSYGVSNAFYTHQLSLSLDLDRL